MIEKTILKLLLKISEQLENISQAQDKVRSEIVLLQQELSSFQSYTLSLENKLKKIRPLEHLLN